MVAIRCDFCREYFDAPGEHVCQNHYLDENGQLAIFSITVSVKKVKE